MKGKLITVVYEIEDPAEWGKTNPLQYQHNGLKAVGVSVGDLQSYSQVPTVFDVYPQLAKAKDTKTTPSCSMAESLARQDLFINSTLATLGGHLVWQLMRRGGINHHGYIVNLNSGLVLPLLVT